MRYHLPMAACGCVHEWQKWRSGGAVVALAAVLTAWSASTAFAAPPPAGTVIGNQAVATFESGGQTLSVTSNLVTTTINEVAGVDIEASQTKSAVAGGKVFFPHTITNTGNSPDTYGLTAPDGADLDVVAIYADADCNGVPDTLTAISQTESLEPGESACVVMEVDVATSATGSPTLTVTATSTVDNTVTDANTDTVTITTGEVLELTKDMTLLSDADGSGSVTPGDTVRVRLTYSNTGAAAATNVSVIDDVPGQLTYSAGTGAWSDGGTMTDATGNTDGTNGQGHTIDYSVTAGTVTAVISSVPAGRTGYVEFTTTIDAGASGTITNTGTIQSDTTTTPQDSNTARITVDEADVVAVTLADANADPATMANAPSGGTDGTYGADTSTTDDDATSNDIVTETGDIAEGSVIPFDVVITNHASTAQRFDLSAAIGNYPAGTTFQFYTAGGSSILDTNSNGQPDVSVAANSAAHFSVRVDLPTGATRTEADTPWDATATATSIANSSVSNTTILRLDNDVTADAVDLQNAGGLAEEGTGEGGDDTTAVGGGPWTTVTVDPGEAASFTLVVVNDGAASDSFNLAASESNFAAGTLPAGWQVVFLDGSGNSVTNTGAIAAGASATFTAEVTPPADATGGTTNIYFRAISATNSSVSDVKMDAVTVNAVTDVAIATDATGQAAPGGTVVLSHTLTNVGNGAVTAGSIAYSPAFPSFSESLWLDNGDGVFDAATDTQIDDIADIPAGSFDPGDSVLIFSRIQVPSTSVAGLTETATVTVTVTGDSNAANNSVSEEVTVVSGNVTVTKLQALDADCNGTADGAFTQAAQAADPGDCIIYQITAANQGTAGVDNLQIDDQTPAYTTYEGTGVATGGSAPTVASQPADEATGAVRSTHGAVAAGGQAVLTFSVQIDE